MRKLLAILVCFLALPLALSAQIAITANVPTSANITNDGFLVLAGSNRYINAQISNTSGSVTALPCGPSTTPSCTGTVNWTCSATGGETCTFTDATHSAVASLTGALAAVQVNIGSVAGDCTQTPGSGSAGPYTLASTVTVTVTAQSTDNTSKTATFPFLVCANAPATLANGTNSVIVTPFYSQAYPGQPVDLQSWVVGATDETGTWAVTSTPATHNETLSDTTYRDTLFSATDPGEYVVTYTSTATGGSQTATIYVGTDALPSYPATPNGTAPVECSNGDTTAFSTIYDVGPTQTYHTLESLPDPATWSIGTLVRLHNEDTTGLSPTTYAEYLNIQKSGSRAHPVELCGVPDSLGNLPVLNEANATSFSSARLYGYGGVVLFPSSHYGYWQTGSNGPSNVIVAGIRIENANPGNSFTTPGGVAAGCPPNYTTSATSCPWITGAAGVYVGSGSDIVLAGLDLDSNPSGVFSAENGNNMWSTITQNLSIHGLHIHGMFWDGLEHGLYLQSFYAAADGILVNDPAAGATKGSDLKWRGVEGIFRYNYLGIGAARSIDMVENQDASKYTIIEQYDATAGPWKDGDTAGPNVVAWYQQSAQNDMAYGNLLFGGSGDQYEVHYAEDHDGGLTARNGTLWFYNNTVNPAQVVFDNNTSGGYNTYFQPRVTAQNNILWAPGTDMATQRTEPLIFNGLTNLYHTGSMVITTPIVGGLYNAGTATGWQSGCDYTCKWPLTNPLNTHIYNLTSANYLLTSTQPMDSTTFAPVSGSAAINAGSALAGMAAQLPIRWQYSVNTQALIARSSPLTIGAVETSPPPVLSSITVTPSTATTGVGQTAQFTATCVYVGGSTSDCTSGATWTSSNTAVATVSGSGLATGVTAGGPVTITATSGAISGTATMSTFVVPTSSWGNLVGANFGVQ